MSNMSNINNEKNDSRCESNQSGNRSQLIFTSSMSTIESLDTGEKDVQSYQ